jgi:hypothetical protein
MALYVIADFSRNALAYWTRYAILPLFRWDPHGIGFYQFLMSHLFVLTFVPAFLVSLANARLRHYVARFVWIVPVTIFTYNFVFSTPTIYPTMPLQSDFGLAFHHWFGGGSGPDNAIMSWRLYHQFNFTAPFYAGIAYSLGAWLAMSVRLPKLEALLRKW